MTLALLPARAGSKSIKNKNLANLNGFPLIHYTIESAKKASCIDEIVVSSDGDSILAYALEQGVRALKRPKELATDSTQSHEVILHALSHYKEFENIILLQPTSPLRDFKDIDNAFRIFVEKKANALISVSAIDNKILKAFITDENGYLRGICNDIYPFMPRQSLPETYQSNGAIYIIKRDLFLQNPNFLPPKTHYYVMNDENSIDIDTHKDLEQANSILQQRHYNGVL